MKSLVVLSISLILLNINSYGLQNPWNTFLLKKGGGFINAKNQFKGQGNITVSYSINYYNAVENVIAEPNVKHADLIGNEFPGFIDTPSFSQNIEFVSAITDTYTIAFNKFSASDGSLNKDLVNISLKPVADSLVNFANKEDVSISSSVSNVANKDSLELNKKNLTIEIPGQVPNGITFLSVGFISGKTWIHKLMIK